MTIASEIERLQTAKSDIKTSIENKGVNVPSDVKLDDYPPYIDQIGQGYIPGGPMSGVTITSTEYFASGDDRATLYPNGGNISIVNGDVLFGIITGKRRHDRSDTDSRNSVVLGIWKYPGQDFSYTKLSGTSVSKVWRGGNLRVLTDGNIVRLLTSYFERTWTSGRDTAEYDIYDFDPSAMTITLTGTGLLSTEGTFLRCPASEFGYEGFTDFTGTVPGYTNGRFNNAQLNDAYYPTFKLA